MSMFLLQTRQMWEKLDVLAIALAVLLLLCPNEGAANGTVVSKSADRFWILWERVRYAGEHCPFGQDCNEMRSFSARPLTTNNTGFIFRLFGLQAPLAGPQPLPNTHPDAPSFCEKSSSRPAVEPLAMPKSEKVEVLRGVKALHLDLSNLKSPPGFRQDFGAKLQKQFSDILRGAGIKVVSKEALAQIPGQPVLNVYFSFSDPEELCDYTYSVFASLSQDVLLARDLRIKVAAGVWSFSTGSSARDHKGNEADAILAVAAAFVRDHQRVNSH